DDQLPADLDRDAVFGAELHHRPAPGPAQGRLQAARPVVHPGVDDSRVVAGLVLADLRLFLQYADFGAGPVEQQLAGGGQADHTTADHDITGHISTVAGAGTGGATGCRRVASTGRVRTHPAGSLPAWGCPSSGWRRTSRGGSSRCRTTSPPPTPRPWPYG